MSDQSKNDGPAKDAAQEPPSPRELTPYEAVFEPALSEDPYVLEGDSADGELGWCSSIEPEDLTPIVRMGGRICSAEAQTTALELVDKVLAAAGPTGSPVVILRRIEAAHSAVVTEIAERIQRRNADLELRLDVGQFAAELMESLGLPGPGAHINWDRFDECLVIQLSRRSL